jgi:alanine-synthesizing transaminase
MKTVHKSAKLANVCYDIRGPIMDAARQMEEDGHKIIKLNIGNLAVFGFDAARGDPAGHDPQPAQLGGLLGQQGHFRGAQGRDALHAGKGHQGRHAGRHLPGQRRQRADRDGHQRAAQHGDELLLPAPDYPLWTAAASLSGGTPVHYLCDEANGWMPDLDDIRAKITPAPRASSSSTPTTPPARCIPTSCCGHRRASPASTSW